LEMGLAMVRLAQLLEILGTGGSQRFASADVFGF
jgi:hypothetical protein